MNKYTYYLQIDYINSTSAIGTLSWYPLSLRLVKDEGRDDLGAELGREFGLELGRDFEVALLVPAYP